MKVVFTKTFEKSLLKLESEIQKRIIEKIDAFLLWDENLDIKKLQPKERWIFRLIVWKYRILFCYMDWETIQLINVDNRDSIYMF